MLLPQQVLRYLLGDCTSMTRSPCRNDYLTHPQANRYNDILFYRVATNTTYHRVARFWLLKGLDNAQTYMATKAYSTPS